MFDFNSWMLFNSVSGIKNINWVHLAISNFNKQSVALQPGGALAQELGKDRDKNKHNIYLRDSQNAPIRNNNKTTG